MFAVGDLGVYFGATRVWGEFCLALLRLKVQKLKSSSSIAKGPCCAKAVSFLE